MDEKENQKFAEMKVKSRKWVGNIEEDHTYDSSTSIGSISEDSVDSSCSSSSSSEMADEEASSSSSTNYLSTSSSSSLSSNGPLFELSQLMTHLPIKRGLSMFYEGKAQSFSCLGRVKSLEDVPKKGKPYHHRKKMKSCKSYGGDLDTHTHKISYTPKPSISKKTSASRLSSSSSFVSSLNKRGSFLGMHRPSINAAQRNF
ncbi:uncharacterized protein G2W53_025206 [Senna tora]|uniref:Oxidative stress 3 n=1 Tax=Senna tora TaxID=362788 RepID=A0A834TEP7_9FABA|nr:uncharacterized protein G2W53_025206 [Senna tora]